MMALRTFAARAGFLLLYHETVNFSKTEIHLSLTIQYGISVRAY